MVVALFAVPAMWILSACTGQAAAPDSSASGASAESAVSGTALYSAGPAVSQPEIEPGPTTPVPPPTPGNISSLASTVVPSVLPETSLSATVMPATDISVGLKEIESVDAVSITPGEVNGPAAQITVEIQNGTDAALDVNSVEVGLTDSMGQPGIPVTTAASSSFSGQIAPGSTATGVYVFRVPPDHRNPILVTVSYTAGGALAQFSGTIK